jgi:Ser/Thr protein kinase RdoA (MazF antagonist)
MPEMPVLPSRPPRSLPVAALCGRWFPDTQVTPEPLVAAGFSGSLLHRVIAGEQTYVLKSFAPGASPGRIRFVHALMRHLRDRGVEQVPAVLNDAAGESFVVDGEGRSWELLEFMPGEPSEQPGPEAVAEAVRLLGKVHAAAATMPENPPDHGPSPGMSRRISQARAWLAMPWRPLLERPDTEAGVRSLLAEVRLRVARAADSVAAADGRRIMAAIAALEPRPVGRQAVLRDIWSAHVLFAAGRHPRVTGLLDYHAAGIESPAADIARLLGSWLEPAAIETIWWFEFMAAYLDGGGRPGLQQAVPFLAASGILFGLDNWFRWILVEGRRFAAPAPVLARIDRLVASLPIALEILANPLLCPGLTGKNSSL